MTRLMETGGPSAGVGQEHAEPWTGHATKPRHDLDDPNALRRGSIRSPAPRELDEPPPEQAERVRLDAPTTRTPDSAGLLRRIAAVVAAIPPGRVATYGQVAAQAGNRRAARQVAWALRAYADSGLPWHRVIGAGGAIRLPEGGGLERQRSLLLAEGVAVSPDGRLDLAAHQWRP
ncbi:MAG: MGMT family protein [Spirochaetaceae bacterium]|nr:MGMT family protein [Spirochaetaceae bacterium]